MTASFEIDFSKPGQDRELAQHIVSLLQGIRYGSVELVVHDGRLVQIDKREKFRVKSPQLAQ